MLDAGSILKKVRRNEYLSEQDDRNRAKKDFLDLIPFLTVKK